MSQFIKNISIRFGDIDQAGIVYYPRIFHYYHYAFEDFFEAAHGTPYPDWIHKRRTGFPTVHVEADFLCPLRYGDALDIAVTTPRLGRRSVDFHFQVRQAETVAAWARVTKACVDMDELSPMDIPEDLRLVLQRYGGAE